jgi:HAMP domain-containing protein
MESGPASVGSRGWTLSYRLAALIAVLLVTSAVVTTISVFQSVQSTMRDESSQSVDNVHESVNALIAQEYGGIRAFRNSTLDERKTALNDLRAPIVAALDALRAEVAAGNLTEEQAQSTAKSMIRSIRFGNDDYVFAFDRDMDSIAHPDPEIEGRSLLDLQDADGEYFVREFRDVALEFGSGYVPYRWVRLGEEQPAPKIGYVFAYPPWDWIIGTGVYVDDVDAAADRRLEAARANLAGSLANIGFRTDGFFFVLNDSGQVVVSPAGTDLDALESTPEGQELARQLVAGAPATGTSTLAVDGALGSGEAREWLVKVSSFDPLGWVLVSAVPSAQLAEPGRELALRQVGLAALVLVLGLVAGLLLSRRIARPVEDVTRAASTLAEDRFDPATLDRAAERADEVGTLARTFRAMAVEVVARERALREQVTRLTVEIDASRREAAVREIVETDFFADLSEKAAEMRRRIRGEDGPE